MRKMMLFVIALVTLVMPLAAQATPHCKNHTCQSFSYVSESYYPEYASITKHCFEEVYRCDYCGEIKYEKAYYEHQYAGDHCVWCGFQKPDRETLNMDALYREADIINCSCWVMYRGNIYREAGYYAQTRGMTEENSSYYVHDYEEMSDGTVWCQIKKTSVSDPIGWVPAETIYINPRPVDNHETYETVKIAVTSGRGRKGAGQEYPVVAYVHRGEEYTVLDKDVSSTGSVWYKIKVGQKYCWISSGLVDQG